MSRIINSLGLSLIREYEGCKLEAYQDGRGIWTIGTGHTHGVKKGDTCSQHQADAWLEQDLIAAENVVSQHVTVPLTDNQFAALVSFVFNVGGPNFIESTLLRKLNDGQYDSVPSELARWNYSGPKPCPGLAKRRAAEGALWSMKGN